MSPVNNSSQKSPRSPQPAWVWWLIGATTLPTLATICAFSYLLIQANRQVNGASPNVTLKLTLNRWQMAWSVKPEPVPVRIVMVNEPTKLQVPPVGVTPAKKKNPSQAQLRLMEMQQVQTQWQPVLARQHTMYERMLTTLQVQALKEIRAQVQQTQKAVAHTAKLQKHAANMSAQLVHTPDTLPASAHWQLCERVLLAQQLAGQSLPALPTGKAKLTLLESDYVVITQRLKRYSQAHAALTRQLAQASEQLKEAARLAPYSPHRDPKLTPEFARSYDRAYGTQQEKANQTARMASRSLTEFATELKSLETLLQATIAGEQQAPAPRTFALAQEKSFAHALNTVEPNNWQELYLLAKEIEEHNKELYNRSLIYAKAVQDKITFKQATTRVTLLPLSNHRITETNAYHSAPTFTSEFERIYKRMKTQRFQLLQQQKRYGTMTLAQVTPKARNKPAS